MLTRSQLGALGFGSFVMATGMLVEMAADLSLPVTVVGQLVAAAPLMLAIASPTLAFTTSRLSRRTLLIAGGLVAGASHFLAAASGSLAMLALARMLTGLGASHHPDKAIGSLLARSGLGNAARSFTAR